MNNYTFGCIKSPHDSRDYLLEGLVDTVNLPASVDNRDKMTPVRHQKNEGACVGFAMTVGVKEYQEQKDYGKFIELAPRFIYEEAKKISGHSEGTTLKAAVEVAKKLGVCEEYFWPYKPREPGFAKDGAYENALKYRIQSYVRITNLQELKAAIADEDIQCALIGVLVFKGMISDTCKKTGYVPNPSCFEKLKPLGGHALEAVGYADTSDYFNNDGHIICKNSWGDTYGDEGYIYLSYKYINANMMDAFSSIDIPSDEIQYVERLGTGRVWVA